ncbi:putative glycosyltransferase [Sulfolobales Beppu filamentous virus 2]|uniref:Putative glycosyltransferase n=1 Tax=Sulfolobales Beppu filamentous virus 2 TaxID=2493123 RepID=A0A3S8NEW2_9VIRU|nr:putative glycosyltransferase [Sulfolobales Beppu filamentous virus 2]AZI75793.1 putative glycosyltransferase [Sulfolobales Beppu filamentous virus 2]
MKGFGWENQVPYPYIQYLPYPDVKNVLIYGDHAWLPEQIKHYKRVVVWTDTPLVDCNFPIYDNTVFVPASNFVKAVLENCEVKNVTEVIHKPLRLQKRHIVKKYDMVAVLTQFMRKGHESLSRVLKRLDGMLDREVTLKLRVHENIRLFFQGYKNIRLIDIPRTPSYNEYINEVGSARILLFPSYVEGIGYPPIEATQLYQQVIMGDIDATREFVEVKSARVTDVKLVNLPGTNHWFLYQYYDEDEYLDLLIKALQDPDCCRPKLKTPDVLEVEKLFERVVGLLGDNIL